MNHPSKKFNIGDKVRLLPSITQRFITSKEIGKIGTITGSRDYAYIVRTDNYCGWFVLKEDIAPAFKAGHQFLLWNDMFD